MKKEIETIFVESFITHYPGENWDDVMKNVSGHCHRTHNKVKLYCGDSFKSYVTSIENSTTFPNVVYIQKLYVTYYDASIKNDFPDLIKVGHFHCLPRLMDYGNIKEIDYYNNMSSYKTRGYILDRTCNPLGDDIYRFTHKITGEYWDIKVNRFD